METRTINSTTGTNGIGSAGAAGKIDPCAHLETPISPHSEFKSSKNVQKVDIGKKKF